VNPNAPHPTSPVAMVNSTWSHRKLIIQMTRREIAGRYKGSFLGLAWSFFNPMLMLSVYTFVFSFVFKARWAITEAVSNVDFALVLFVGLILHALLAEVWTRAPGLIIANSNYVKKVVFPLEILNLINLCTALFHAFISCVVLLFAMVVLVGVPHWTILLSPLTVFPMVPLILGIGWILASFGVFLRDIGQFIGIITTAMLFLAPVFYPASSLPTEYQHWLNLNPLTIPIEATRQVILFGHLPNWLALGSYTFVSLFIAWFGFYWFQRTRKGFDVI
jgi:lipopolysaccharide transport system permease protein